MKEMTPTEQYLYSLAVEHWRWFQETTREGGSVEIDHSVTQKISEIKRGVQELKNNSPEGCKHHAIMSLYFHGGNYYCDVCMNCNELIFSGKNEQS
jgi:hypothetical protein